MNCILMTLVSPFVFWPQIHVLHKLRITKASGRVPLDTFTLFLILLQTFFGCIQFFRALVRDEIESELLGFI